MPTRFDTRRLARIDRRRLAHFGAPALFLIAVTASVVVVHSTYSSSSSPATTATTAPLTTRTSTLPAKPVKASYYRIQSGDTLGALAYRFETTVDVLLQLNPGIDPNALAVGQRIRVGPAP
jgi:LysM repeat protein